MALHELLDEALGGAGDGALWRFPEEKIEITLGEIVAAGLRYSAAFGALGVRRGDRVGIVLDNVPDYPTILLGLWNAAAVAVPLRPHGGLQLDLGAFLRRVDDACELRLVVVGDDVDDALPSACAGEPRKVLQRGRLRAMASAETKPVRRRVSGRDMAIIQYSSGSTAHPKGIVVTHDMVLSQLSQLERGYRRDCNAAGIASSGSWLPFHHDMGLFIGILFPLFTRCANVLASPRFYMYKPKRWFALQAELSVEWNFSTNLAMASSLVSLGQLAPGSLDLSRFFLYLGAEKVSPVVLRRSREAFGRFGMPADHLRVGYGLAENTLGAASTKGYPDSVFVTVDAEDRVHLSRAPSEGAVEIASIGRPHLDTTITVRDEGGRVLPQLTLGELCIEGRCVTPGYYRDARATSHAVTRGVLRTRDLGFRCGEDLFFFARKDDLLVVGGRNIAPDDVEDCAEVVAGIGPGAAVLIDVPNELTGKTELVLLVELAARVSDEEATRRGIEIRSRVLAQRGVLLNKVAFAARGALEKTSSGKKRRRVIRERFMRHQLALR